MAKGCALKPCVRSKKTGEPVDSKLWNDLYDLTGKNRTRTIGLYALATDESFLSSVRDRAQYDENGQITANSFIKLAGLRKEISNEFNRLSKNYNGSITRSELEGVSERFISEGVSDDYALDIKWNGNGYDVSVVERTDKTSDDMYESLRKDRLVSLISERLKSVGLSYRFVGGVDYNGKFSTENIDSTADGLAHLIEISVNAANPKDTLVEEVAHFAVLATKDKQIVSRLISAIADMRRQGKLNTLFTEEEINSAALNPNFMDMELAGKLVAKSMMNTPVNFLGNLLSRVKSFIYSVFSKLSAKGVMYDKYMAKAYAESISRGYMFDEDSIDVEAALSKPITLYSVDASNDNVNHITKVVRRISVLNNEVMQMSTAMATTSDFMKLRPGEMLDGLTEGSANAKTAATFTINAVSSVLDIFNKAFDTLSKIDSMDFDDLNTTRNDIDTYVECVEAFKAIMDICEYYDTFINNTKVELKVNGGIDKVTEAQLDDVATKLANIKSQFETERIHSKLLDYGRVFMASQMTLAYDTASIAVPSRIIAKGLSIRRRDGRDVSMNRLASRYTKDFTYGNSGTLSKIGGFLKNAKFSADALTQFMDKVARTNRSLTLRKRNERIVELKALRDRFKKAGYSEDSMYERIVAPPVVTFVSQDESTGDCTYRINDKEFTIDNSIGGFPVVWDNNGVWYLDDINTGMKVDYSNTVASGYYISSVHKGQFKLDEKILKRRLKSEFLKEHKRKGTLDDFNTKTKAEKMKLLDDYINRSQEYKDFLADAFDDVKEKIYSSKYENKEFTRLSQDRKWLKLYNDIMAYKDEVDDECLYEREGFGITDGTKGKKHFVKLKRPQYRKGFIGRYKSHRLEEADLYNGKFNKYLCENITSNEFGDVTTDTELTAFNDPHSLYEDGLRRIPISGINDIADIRELSDDLFGSLSAYTDMAYKYYGLQQIYSTMKLVDAVADGRESGDFSEKQKSVIRQRTQKERDVIMDTYVFSSDRNKSKWAKVFNFAAMASSIWAMIASPIIGIKNYLSGVNTFLKDGAVGNFGFTAKSISKRFAMDLFNVRHHAANVASLAVGHKVEWDKYQKLTDRFDAFRNPVMTDSLNKHFNPLKYLINIGMAWISMGDNSLISIIYRAYLDDNCVFDTRGNKIKLIDTYDFDDKGNPSLKNGFIKDRRDVDYYNKLYAAREDLIDLIEYNEDKMSSQKMHAFDKDSIRDLNDFIINNQTKLDEVRANVRIDLNNNGTLKGEHELFNIITNEIDRISYTLRDESDMIRKVDDYISLSQGYYGMMNASIAQSTEYVAPFTKLLGYIFAYTQRQFMTNIRMDTKSFMHGLFKTQLLALATVFLPHKDDVDKMVPYFKDWRFRVATLTATMVPFALKNNKLRTQLIDNGWDPDQLNQLSFSIIGWLGNFILMWLCIKMLSKGNRQSVGENMKIHKSRRDGVVTYQEPGMLTNFEIFDEDSANEEFDKWKAKGYPYNMSQKSKNNVIDLETLDYPAYETYDDVKAIDNPKEGDIVYLREMGTHYRYYDSKKRKGWYKYEMGYYDEDSEEWNEYVEAINMSNIKYDTSDPAYYYYGFLYKMSRGILNEQMSMLSPLSTAGTLLDLGGTIAASTVKGVTRLIDRVASDNDNSMTKHWNTTINRNLKKVNLELDGPGGIFTSYKGSDGYHNITYIDNYKAQEDADRFRKNNRIFMTLEDLVFNR